MSEPTLQQQLWASMLAEKRSMLYDARAEKMLNWRDFSTAEASVAELRLRHASGRSHHCFDRMRPVLDKLRAFERAVTVFIQSDPTYSSLVRSRNWQISSSVDIVPGMGWRPVVSRGGSIGVHEDFTADQLRKCAVRYHDIFDRMTEMFARIATAMPRFEQYMMLYPSRTTLQSALVGIYGGYIDFCVHAVKFFRYKPLCKYDSMSMSIFAK